LQLVDGFIRWLLIMKKILCACLLAYGSLDAMGQAPSYNFYYGNLHSHSGYSDGNQDSTSSGRSTPLQDYQFAAASQHFDFLGISEHNHSQAGMHLRDFARGRAQATQATTGSFVALHGTEWGVISGGGHMLLYGIHQLYGWEAGNYDVYVALNDYQALMRQLNQVPGAFALFAHPQSGDYGALASAGTPFSATADSALVGTPLRSGPANATSTLYDQTGTSYESTYRAMLAKGYHVGISLDHDNHKTAFGRTTVGRTVVLAESLTEEALLQALRARRFYGSDDWNAQVSLRCNGQPMGSIVTNPAAAAVTVNVGDIDGEAVRSITLLRGVPGSGTNAVSVATTGSGVAALSYTDPAPSGTAYYYAVVLQADGDRIVTSPIWYTRGAVVSGTAVAAEPLALDVFPNPAAGGVVTLSYYLEQPETVRLTVLDAVGREVLTVDGGDAQAPGPHAAVLQAGELAAGVYVVRAVIGEQVAYRRLVVE
jgi:hypothetical protein